MSRKCFDAARPPILADLRNRFIDVAVRPINWKTSMTVTYQRGSAHLFRNLRELKEILVNRAQPHDHEGITVALTMPA